MDDMKVKLWCVNHNQMDLLGPLIEDKQHMLFACLLRYKSNENVYLNGISPNVHLYEKPYYDL